MSDSNASSSSIHVDKQTESATTTSQNTLHMSRAFASQSRNRAILGSRGSRRLNLCYRNHFIAFLWVFLGSVLGAVFSWVWSSANVNTRIEFFPYSTTYNYLIRAGIVVSCFYLSDTCIKNEAAVIEPKHKSGIDFMDVWLIDNGWNMLVLWVNGRFANNLIYPEYT